MHWYTIDQASWMSTSRKVSKVDFPAMPVLLFWGASCMYAWLCLWQYRLSRFQGGIQNWKGICLKINIPKENHWILRIAVVGRCQKVPKFDFQSPFSMSKIIGIFLNFCIKNNGRMKWSTLQTLIFASHWGSPLVQFSKFNDFLWVCWFLCKNLSNFVSLDLKLHNR